MSRINQIGIELFKSKYSGRFERNHTHSFTLQVYADKIDDLGVIWLSVLEYSLATPCQDHGLLLILKGKNK